MIPRQSPFIVGVLANLSGEPSMPLPKLRERRFVTVNQKSFARYFSHTKPQLAPSARSESSPDGVVNLTLIFEGVEDFRAECVAQRLQELNVLESAAAEKLREALMLHDSFQALHGAWAGLKYLVDSVAGNPNIEVKALDVSKRDLLRDLQRTSEPDQSALFKLVFSQGVGTFGGEAFGCLIGDYYLTSRTEDRELLQSVSYVAAAAGAPFLTGAEPDIFWISQWKEGGPEVPSGLHCAGPVNALGQHSAEQADGWAAFLFVPRVRPTDGAAVAFEPSSADSSGRQLDSAWLNPAFVVGRIISEAFSGSTSGGIVRKLFPQWNDNAPSFPVGSGMASGGDREGRPKASTGFALEFESDFSLRAESRFGEFGINVLSESRLARSDVLEGLVASVPANSEPSRPGLAQALLCCRICNRVRDYLRMKRRTRDRVQVLQLVEGWLHAISVDPLTGQWLLPFETISATADAVGIGLHFSLVPDACRQSPTRSLRLVVPWE